MTNNDVVILMNSGLLAISSRALPLNYAYEVTKVKGAIDKAFKAWDEKFKKLDAEAGIEDSKAFNKRYNEFEEKRKAGTLNTLEKDALEEMNATLERLNGLRQKLADEPVKIKSNPLPYEIWMELKEANKDIKSGTAECLELVESKLEGILWKALEEEEMAQAEKK